MSIETIKVTRFRGKISFSAFKHKVLAYLQTFGLKDMVVSGTETRGTSSSSSGSSGKRSGEEICSKSERAYAILLNLLPCVWCAIIVCVQQLLLLYCIFVC